MAVLYSDGYCGWHESEQNRTDPKKIHAFLNGKPVNKGCARLGWVPVGRRYRFDYYDGIETLKIEGEEKYEYVAETVSMFVPDDELEWKLRDNLNIKSSHKFK